ncbi:MAG: hypothetical protein ACTSRH_02205 [Promethearchaeota archaeon]
MTSSDNEYKPKFMEWGIINNDNFSNIYDIPLKRWDPLSTISITTSEFGLDEHKKRFYGHYAYISPIRGKRPKGFDELKKKLMNIKCSEIDFNDYVDVFKAVTEGHPIYDEKTGSLIGDGFTIIIMEDEKRRDNPFHDKPHRIQKLPDTCKAITLINRYPSMARVVDPEIEKIISKKLPSHLKLARGINLVTISRNFYPSFCFDLIPEDVLSGIFLSMKEAILYCVLEAIDKDYYDIPVNPFFNIGTKVGGSQPRIHGQVYIDLNGDGHGLRLEGYLRAFKEMGNNCHLCSTSHGNSERVILKTEYWTFYLTGSPIRNYHIRFHPNEHVRRFTQLKINQFNDLANSLKIVFHALDEINVERNRNIIFNSCPYGYDANFHMFGDIIPHEIIGGAEMADDMRVARKSPNLAARELRNAIQKFLNKK